MKRLLLAASAAALSFALTAPSLSAQDQDLGLMQLQDSAVSNMAKLNMSTEMVPVLTLDELARIQAITNSGGSEQSQKDRIDTVLRGAEERIADGGAVVPTGPAGDVSASSLEGIADIRHSVRADIAQMGMNSEIDVDRLTDDQLMRIHLISQSDIAESAKKMQIEKIATEG